MFRNYFARCLNVKTHHGICVSGNGRRAWLSPRFGRKIVLAATRFVRPAAFPVGLFVESKPNIRATVSISIASVLSSMGWAV